MNESLKISAKEADQSVTQWRQEMNSSRRIPPVLPRLQKIAADEQIYIYNVGPFEKTRALGSAGTFYIAPCPEGRDYSDPLIIPGLIFEPYPIDDKEMKLMQDEGSYIAEQVLGVGKHIPASQSFVPYGIFISQTRPPAKEDVAKAKRALNTFLQGLVSEMNAAWAQGPTEAKNTKSPNHVLAAQILRKTTAECPWMADSSVQVDRAECTACGEIYRVGLILCKSCGFILDPAKFAKNKDNFASR